MTALCGGGLSGPKAGVAETIIFTAGAIASLLNNKGGAWATLAAPLLGVLTYQAEELCEVDPPADPGMTSDDYLALLRLNDWPALQAALVKLADLVKIAVWFELCECKTTSTPAAPAIPSPDGVSNPHGVAAATCAALEDAEDIAFAGTYNFFQTNPLSGSWDTAVVLPVGASYVRITVSRPTTANTNVWTFNPMFMWADGASVEQPASFVNVSLANGQTKVVEALLDRTNYWKARVSLDSVGTNGGEVTMRMDVWCGVVPGQALASCCPPDPALMALMQQVLQLLTVVQRNGVPFAYAPHSEHAGLTGSGEVAATETIAATITLTTLPAGYGMAEGHPDVVFDAGYVAFGNTEGFGPPQRIRTSPMFLRVPTDTTRIGYSLGPGIVATIKRHAAEP